MYFYRHKSAEESGSANILARIARDLKSAKAKSQDIYGSNMIAQCTSKHSRVPPEGAKAQARRPNKSASSTGV